jgi:RibD domain-containing protein
VVDGGRDFVAHEDLSSLREFPDPRGETHRAAEVVACLEDDRSAVDPDVRGRQARVGDRLQDLEGRRHRVLGATGVAPYEPSDEPIGPGRRLLRPPSSGDAEEGDRLRDTLEATSRIRSNANAPSAAASATASLARTSPGLAASAIGIMGANHDQQFLAAGLVDEIRIHLVDVLLGGGRRLFDELPQRFDLELKGLSQTGSVAHLEYRASASVEEAPELLLLVVQAPHRQVDGRSRHPECAVDAYTAAIAVRATESTHVRRMLGAGASL